MFLNNDLLKSEFMFKSNDVDSLSEMLAYIAYLTPEEITKINNEFNKSLINYGIKFKNEINELYQDIIENRIE